MSNSRTYEVQAFRNGRWKVDSMYDDRELALFEAQRALAGTHCTGVRVCEETYSETTGKFVTRTIFRKTKVDDSNRETVERERSHRQEAEARRPPAPTGSAVAAAAGTSASCSDAALVFQIVLAGIVVLAGVAAILILRHFQ